MGRIRWLAAHAAWGSQSLSCVPLAVTAKSVFVKVVMDAIIGELSV